MICLKYVRFINGCAPDALMRNSFVILRMVATARYLHLKAQELHDALEASSIDGLTWW